MNQASEHGFSVVYHPAETRRDDISAKSLAISLAGFVDLFETVNKAVGEENSRVELSFKGSRAGSVECIFDLIELGLPAGAMIAPELTSYAAEIRRMVVGKDGLFALIPRLRRPSSSGMSDPGIIEERADGSRTVIDKDVAMKHPHIAELAVKKDIQVSAWKALHPMATEECSSLDLVDAQGSTSTIDRDNLQHFRPIDPTDTVTVKIVEMKLTVIEVVFEGNARWKMRVEPGKDQISCQVTDAEFLAEIGNGLRFGKGDVIDAVVKFTLTQSDSDGRTKRDYEVIKVHSHRDPTANWSEPLYSSSSRLI